MLGAWCFEPAALAVFQPLEELFTAGQVTGWQRAMVLSEPWQQVIVFNSFSFHTFPYPVLLVSGSLLGRPLFFLIVLCPYYSFLCFAGLSFTPDTSKRVINSSYSILQPLSSLKLAACCFSFFFLLIRIILICFLQLEACRL